MLGKYLTDAVKDNTEEERLEELIQENGQLHDEINDLKAKIKETVQKEVHDEMLKAKEASEAKLVKIEDECSTLKKTNDKLIQEKDEALVDQTKLKSEKQLMQVEVSKAN
mmetsp:Transcript_30593/g.46926  ORF Transcript_30593/g.46926 Transcript_30593/m.46926 type:complete len:110 (+) Transcript_30593:1954-2283(+)